MEQTLQADPRLCQDRTVRWLQERADGSASEGPCITLGGLRQCRNPCPNHRGRKHLHFLGPARMRERMLIDGAIGADFDKGVVSRSESDLEGLHARAAHTPVVLARAPHQLIVRLRRDRADGILAVTDLTCIDPLRDPFTLGLLIFHTGVRSCLAS